MKLLGIIGIASVVMLGSMGASAAPKQVEAPKAPALTAKQSLIKVRYTYRQCLEESRLMCKALHPNDTPAATECWMERIDTICAGLPGAP